MLGFAVVDTLVDGGVCVWLVSKVTPAEATATNAVVWSSADLADDEAVGRLRGMLSDRFVATTPEADRAALEAVLGEHLPADARLDELRASVSTSISSAQAAFADENARRRTERKNRVIEPAWPGLTEPGPAAEPGDTSGRRTHAALLLANRISRAWTAWLALVSLVPTRPYLLGALGPLNDLPESFTSSHEVMAARRTR